MMSSPAQLAPLRASVMLTAALALPASASAEPSLPGPVREAAPELDLQGKGSLSKLFFHVYDARLWTSGDGWSPDRPAALDIVYGRDFPAAGLAERSVEEMAKLGRATGEQRREWLAEMKRAFPDVEEGDRVIGLHAPGEGMRFYVNGERYSRIDDPAFGPAFLGIWLDPGTSEPELRRRLLGRDG